MAPGRCVLDTSFLVDALMSGQRHHSAGALVALGPRARPPKPEEFWRRPYELREIEDAGD